MQKKDSALRSMADYYAEQRNFSFVSMLGFGAVLICTWEIIFASVFISHNLPVVEAP